MAQVIASAAGQLLGRALRSCAPASLPGCKACVELSQEEGSPNALVLRVSDDGAHLPDEGEVVLAAYSDLAELLSHPCWGQNQLRVRTAGPEETVIRSYVLGTLPEHPLTLQLLQRHLQPQLSERHVRGTECTLAASLGAVRPGEVVDWVQQTLAALAALGAPVHMTLRLRGLLVQCEDGGEERINWSERLDVQLPSELSPLQRMRACLLAQFREEEEAPPAEAAARVAGPHTPGEEGLGTGSAAGAAAADGAAPEPLLTYAGVGEAAALRGCRWSARAGIVLQLPNHAQLQQAQQEAGEERAGARLAAPPADAQDASGETPVLLFRDHSAALGDVATAAKGVTRCEWGQFGFALESLRAEGSGSGGGGALRAVLRCAQPLSQAHIAAVLVHLQPCDPSLRLRTGAPPSLAPKHEARLVRLALEAALCDLRGQAPAVVAGRRDRSLIRALPCLLEAVAGIVAQSAASDPPLRGVGLPELACQELGCEEALGGADFAGKLEAALHATVQAALGRAA